MSKKPRKAHLPGSIPVWIRIALVAASIVSGVIGYIAIMRANTPEVGGVAFIALAGLFAVLAVVGRVPLKVNAGNMGFEFAETEKLVDAAEELSPASRIEFAERLSAHGGNNPIYKVASEAILAGASFERLVVDVLRSAGWVDDNFTESAAGDSGIDVVIRLRDRRYAVMIKAVRGRRLEISDGSRLLLEAVRLNLDGAVIIVPDTHSNVHALVVLNGVLVVPASRVRELPDLLE